MHSKPAARRKRLEALKYEQRTLVFYESSHRILKTLVDMGELFGSARQAVIGRELTKQFETVLSGSLAELSARVAEDSNQQKGEFVVIVAGAEAKATAHGAEQERVLTLLLDELPPARAAKLAAQITGGRKSEMYTLAQQLGGKDS